MTLILIVDDEPHSLSGLAELVRAEGFETATAADLAGARRALERESPDAVLVDYFLPDTAAAAAAGNGDSVTVTLPAPLADVERQVILATLGLAGGDKARAAETLGISLKTLYSRLREYTGRNPN